VRVLFQNSMDGIGRTIAIAALGGKANWRFSSNPYSDIKKVGKPKKERRLRLAVIGKPNVGREILVTSHFGSTFLVTRPRVNTSQPHHRRVLSPSFAVYAREKKEHVRNHRGEPPNRRRRSRLIPLLRSPS